MNRIITALPAGIVDIPPSKSLSHRALIAAALASETGPCTIVNTGDSQDIAATLGALESLGYGFRLTGGGLVISGKGGPVAREINCAESGSTLRFLLPLAALLDKEIAFSGRGRLMERPLDIYRQLFEKKGVGFGQRDGKVTVRGRLPSGVYSLPGDVSSQFVSGLLFALPLLEGDSEIVLTIPLESKSYVDMTVDMLTRFGVSITQREGRYLVAGGQRYRPVDYTVEGDYSQAAFFLGAAALGRDVACRGLRSNSLQGDRAILDVLARMGATVERSGDLVTVRARRLRGIIVDARQIPDLVPPIAAICCFCDGVSEIVGAGRLRLKESDRLRALAQELGKLGADITEGEDSLRIRGKPFLTGGTAHAHGDHRIAMAVAVASIRCKEPVTVSGAESVEKSYPRFWSDFEKELRRDG